MPHQELAYSDYRYCSS